LTFRGTPAVEHFNRHAAAAQMAVEAGLRYVSSNEPGIRRMRAAKAFYYLTPQNRRLSRARLKRIASLGPYARL